MNSKCTIRNIAILTISSFAYVIATATLAQAAGDNTRLAKAQDLYLAFAKPPIQQAVKKPAPVQVAEANSLDDAVEASSVSEALDASGQAKVLEEKWVVK
jgi:hypothetical protein